MVQEKKKGMDESDKKGRMPGKEEEEKNASHKSTGKTSTSPNKTDSSNSKKSR